MKWSVNKPTERPGARLRLDNGVYIQYQNQSENPVISSISMNVDRFNTLSIAVDTSDSAVILNLGLYGYKETFREESSHFEIENIRQGHELAQLFILLRKEDPAVVDVIDHFYETFELDKPNMLHMDEIARLLEKENVKDAIKLAISKQNIHGISMTQVGRMIEHIYRTCKNDAIVSYEDVIHFYLQITPQTMDLTRANMTLFKFLLSIDCNHFDDKTKIRLLEHKFRAAYLGQEPVTNHLYRELCGDTMDDNLLVLSTVRLTETVDSYILMAAKMRRLQEQVKELEKSATRKRTSLVTMSLLAPTEGVTAETDTAATNDDNTDAHRDKRRKVDSPPRPPLN